jgi:hypothetical protein
LSFCIISAGVGKCAGASAEGCVVASAEGCVVETSALATLLRISALRITHAAKNRPVIVKASRMSLQQALRTNPPIISLIRGPIILSAGME